MDILKIIALGIVKIINICMREREKYHMAVYNIY